MSNLANFVEVVKAPVVDLAEYRAAFEVDVWSSNELVLRYAPEAAPVVAKGMIDSWQAKRREQVEETGFIPDHLLPVANVRDGRMELSSAADVLATASATPKVSLAHVRALAEEAGMPIFPLGHLREQAWPEDRGTRHALEVMVRSLDWCDHYVIAPVMYYDIRKVAEDTTDVRLYYAPSQLSQAFLALDLAMPMFRMVLATDLRVGALEQQMGVVNAQLQVLENQLTRLQAQVDNNQREMARQHAAENEELRRRIEALRAEVFRWRDPLHLAIPKRFSGPNNEGWAFVGSCWGPDLEEIVAAAIRLKDTGARTKVEKSVARWSRLTI